MPPKISVVMPVWNGEKYLRAALDSVLAQTFVDFELIVVDDGSTDGTLGILESYPDPRIKILRLDHGGIVTALNRGVEAARGDWIARQDSDDISRPERFAQQWRAVHEKADAVLSYTDVSLIGLETAGLGRARFPRTKAMLALRLCWQNPIVHSTVMFRKETFLRAGGYLPNERHAEDFALWGRMLETGDFIGLPERLLDFRVHPESVSKGNLETQIALNAEIAVQHCRRFMRLDEAPARRAFNILSSRTVGEAGRGWGWFLCSCAPRLRWKSGEVWSWLCLQTIKRILPR